MVNWWKDCEHEKRIAALVILYLCRCWWKDLMSSYCRDEFFKISKGSSLGPLLFALYVNDLPKASAFKFLFKTVNRLQCRLQSNFYSNQSNRLILASARIGQVSFHTTEKEILCLDYLTGLIKSPAHIMPYTAKSWTLEACWSEMDIPKHTLIAASWNISTRNMKPPLIRSRQQRQWQPPSTCVSSTSGKFPMKSAEKCKDLYTVMPSFPFSFVSYMKPISWKNLLHIKTNRIIFVAQV